MWNILGVGAGNLRNGALRSSPFTKGKGEVESSILAGAQGCAKGIDRRHLVSALSSAAGGEGFANRAFAAYVSISAASAADAADSKRVPALARLGERRVPSSQPSAESPLPRGFRAAAAVNASCPTGPQSPAGGPVSANRARVFSRSGYRFGGRYHDWRAAE